MSLEEAWERYNAIKKNYRRLLTSAPMEHRLDPDSSLSRARKEVGEAFDEYLQALRDLSQLAPEGKLLERPPCRI
jgi:hypothetical protein